MCTNRSLWRVGAKTACNARGCLALIKVHISRAGQTSNLGDRLTVSAIACGIGRANADELGERGKRCLVVGAANRVGCHAQRGRSSAGNDGGRGQDALLEVVNAAVGEVQCAQRRQERQCARSEVGEKRICQVAEVWCEIEYFLSKKGGKKMKPQTERVKKKRKKKKKNKKEEEEKKGRAK